MPERPTSEIIVHDQSRKVPQPRGKDQKIDRELQAELRIAQALAAGADGTLDNISQDRFEAEFKAMALNSKIAAAADLDCYVDWCIAERRAAFPADPVTLVRYIESKVKAKAKPATIVRRIPASPRRTICSDSNRSARAIAWSGRPWSRSARRKSSGRLPQSVLEKAVPAPARRSPSRRCSSAATARFRACAMRPCSRSATTAACASAS